MAAASKGLTERRQKSEIIDIFYGQTKSTIKCCNCSFVRLNNFDCNVTNDIQ